jgi:hypothetical protein
MIILDNVSSAIAPDDRHRVKAIAEAILQHQGYQAADLIELVIDDRAHSGYSVNKAAAEGAVKLAAAIVNYMREDLGARSPEQELLVALQREAGL